MQSTPDIAPDLQCMGAQFVKHGLSISLHGQRVPWMFTAYGPLVFQKLVQVASPFSDWVVKISPL
jgi:hypothetical protein